MSTTNAIILNIKPKTLSKNLFLNGILCKTLVFLALILYLIYLFSSSSSTTTTTSLLQFSPSKNIIKSSKQYYFNSNNIKTNISHLVFGIAASSNTWGKKKHYINSWWKPNITKGYLFLDRTPNDEHLPWPNTSPPYRISSDNSRYMPYNKHGMPFAIRMVRVIEETFMEEHDSSTVRWYVMADDDTVLMIENLVNVLSKYDHMKYYYVGMNSECIVSNFGMSFQMAFGGAGYALSYPLAQALAKNMDTCIKRYPYLYGSDHILQACIADLGVTITLEKGFHQIDLRRNISGFLSAHPQSPFISLHHLDLVSPIFPSMNHYDALNHLMKAASVDQSRLLQQSVCYNKIHNWTFSVSWGYSVQIYDKIIPQSYLQTPIETFGEWRKGAWPPYMFNIRKFNNYSSCGEVPNILFFDSFEGTKLNHFVTTYVKKNHRICANNDDDDHSSNGVMKVHVFSPMDKLHVGDGNRKECCDIIQPIGMDSMAIKLRTCMKHEIIA